MKKPVYKHPCFVTQAEDKRIDEKRFWLKLTIDRDGNDSVVIILKNPSRATKDISDKTIFNVTNYVYRNRKKGIGVTHLKDLVKQKSKMKDLPPISCARMPCSIIPMGPQVQARQQPYNCPSTHGESSPGPLICNRLMQAGFIVIFDL